MLMCFDGSVMDGRDEARFAIYGPDSWFIAADGVWLVEISLAGAELRAAWKGISFARLILQACRLIVEGDSVMIVAWLQGCPVYGVVTHFLVCGIRYMLQGCAIYDTRHIYYEANNVADWIVSFVVHNFG